MKTRSIIWWHENHCYNRCRREIFLFVNYETAKFSIIANSPSYLNMFYSVAKLKTHYIPWVKLVPVASLVGLDSVTTSMSQFYFISTQRIQPVSFIKDLTILALDRFNSPSITWANKLMSTSPYWPSPNWPSPNWPSNFFVPESHLLRLEASGLYS